VGAHLLAAYLVLSGLIFALGAAGLLLRRDPLVMIMAVEMMWNAANLAFAAAARHWGSAAGQVAVFLVIVVAAADAALGLAIVVLVVRRRATVDVDELDTLRG
jgi:NADH-quinone oxidoreductase subunit K